MHIPSSFREKSKKTVKSDQQEHLKYVVPQGLVVRALYHMIRRLSHHFSYAKESYYVKFCNLYIYIKIQRYSACYLKKLEPLNRISSFMDQFVCYIHGKVCS